jgi:PPOX class probable F420-dependent enzyme
VNGLAGSRYLSLTTFRPDGTPVATPVWTVGDGGVLYVWTGEQTGKARRIRHSPAVLLAPCTARGTETGPQVQASAAIVPAAGRPEIWRLFEAKYKLQLRAVVLSGRLRRMLRRPAAAEPERVYLEITPVKA